MMILITVLFLIVASIPMSITSLESIHDNPYATQGTKDFMDGASMLGIIMVIIILLVISKVN